MNNLEYFREMYDRMMRHMHLTFFSASDHLYSCAIMFTIVGNASPAACVLRKARRSLLPITSTAVAAYSRHAYRTSASMYGNSVWSRRPTEKYKKKNTQLYLLYVVLLLYMNIC